MLGTRGAFVNSYTEADGDEARGTLTSEPFEIVGEVITLQVAGGQFPDEEYVELLVDGQRWFSSTGCNSGILGRRVWMTRHLVGSSARVRVVDRRRAGWGHLIVDELVQWRRSPPGSARPGSSVAGSR
jgi:hypothetical protein